MQAPTPFLPDIKNNDQNKNKINEDEFNFELKKEVLSDKNGKFSVFFTANNSAKLCIKAIKDDIIKRIFSNKFPVNTIKENKYFIQFDNLKEICEEISERILKEKITLIEETNSIIISVPLPSSKIKEIIFELKEEEKSDKEIIKELMKSNIELKKELNNIKKDISFLYKYYIINLDSNILDNINQNSTLKNWINPKKNIKANLLYRLSRDGPEISTYHNLCDEKGSTLTLWHMKNIGDKIGFFANSSFDSVSGWKSDPDCFLFNLNQNKKYKIKNYCNYTAFICRKDVGPSASCLGCNPDIPLTYIYHSKIHIDKYFEDASKILPSQNNKEYEVKYEVEDMEIFQIIIGQF